MAANAKKTFKTPLSKLQFVTINGQGKLKYDPEGKLDKEDTANYQYTATALLTKEQAELVNKLIKAFWKDNKPQGATKMKYDLIKPETRLVDGEIDEDGDPLREATGMYSITAKTITEWPSGDTNIIKVLRANGNPLNLGTKTIGEGSEGVIHGTLMINGFKGNEGVNFYLSAIQLKKFVPYVGTTIEAENLGDEDLGDLDDGMDTEDLGATPTPKI